MDHCNIQSLILKAQKYINNKEYKINNLGIYIYAKQKQPGCKKVRG